MELNTLSIAEVCNYWQPETDNEKILHGLLVHYRDIALQMAKVVDELNETIEEVE